MLIAGDLIYKPLPDPAPDVTAVIDLLRPLLVVGIPTYSRNGAARAGGPYPWGSDTLTVGA